MFYTTTPTSRKIEWGDSMSIFRRHEPKFWFTVTNKLTCELKHKLTNTAIAVTGSSKEVEL